MVQGNAPVEASLKIDEWWRAMLVEILRPEDEVMETMEVSRLWIDALSDLSNTEFENLNFAQLWDHRDDETLQELIKARNEIVRLRILRVNPAYFNAARSLGALFETYLNGDKRHKYIYRLSGFLGDFEDSKLLEEKVEEALTQAVPE